MTLCRFCAEELADPRLERCPSCGEAQLAEPGPRPTPPEFVGAAVLGALFLAAGVCCGGGTIVNLGAFAGMGPGAGIPPAPMIVTFAIMGAVCVLHAGAGLGLIMRQNGGRIGGIVCSTIDLGLAVLMLVVAGGIAYTSGSSVLMEAVIIYTVLGVIGLLISITSLWFLLRRATREAFAAREQR